MRRIFTLFLILTLSLYALSNSEILKRADNLAKSSDKSSQFRAYNDYKNLYLRSMMAEDDKLRLSSLNGLVKSGKKLHIDVSKYSKELNTLKHKKKKSYKTSKQNTYKKNKNKVKINNSHKLKSIRFVGDKLILKFDKKLNSKQINYFTLHDDKKKMHKYIFDIHASMLSQSKKLRRAGVDRIKLAQFNSRTLRLVIQNSKKIKIRFVKYGNELRITFPPLKKKRISKALSSTKKMPINAKSIYRKKVIMIDPGHGGKDPGAVGYKKYREKVVVLQIAKKLRSILRDRGFVVHMTRDRDKFIKLSKRTTLANKKEADIFISIHANAVDGKKVRSVHGVECYFLSPSKSARARKVAEKENYADVSEMNRYGKQSFLGFLNHHKIIASNKLAIDLQRGMLGSLNKHYKGVKDGGVREGPFWVLVGAQMPAVLVEVGFISHPKEASRLVNARYQKKLATGLAYGIERYFQNNY